MIILEYSIDIPDSLLPLRVPKLILQPLVENSIKTGYKKRKNLIIAINGFTRDGSAIIEVMDNGGGISQPALDRMIEQLNHDKKPGDSVGLHNISDG